MHVVFDFLYVIKDKIGRVIIRIGVTELVDSLTF